MKAISDTITQPQFCPADPKADQPQNKSASKIKPIAALDTAITDAEKVSEADLRKLVDDLPPLDPDAAKDKKQKDELYTLLKQNISKLTKDGKPDPVEARRLLNGVTARALVACLQKTPTTPQDDAEAKRKLEEATKQAAEDAKKKAEEDAKKKAEAEAQKLFADQKAVLDKQKADQEKALQDEADKLRKAAQDQQAQNDALQKQLQQALGGNQDPNAGAGAGAGDLGSGADTGDTGAGSGSGDSGSGSGGGGSGGGSGSGSGSGNNSPQAQSASNNGDKSNGLVIPETKDVKPELGDKKEKEEESFTREDSPETDDLLGRSKTPQTPALQQPNTIPDSRVSTPSSWSAGGGPTGLTLSGPASALPSIAAQSAPQDLLPATSSPAPMSSSSGSGPSGGSAFDSGVFKFAPRGVRKPPKKFSYGRTSPKDYGTATGGFEAPEAPGNDEMALPAGSVGKRMQAAISAGRGSANRAPAFEARGVFRTMGKTLKDLCHAPQGAASVGVCGRMSKKSASGPVAQAR